MQPPSGGCVLKLNNHGYIVSIYHAAAFGRLCVETLKSWVIFNTSSAAAFGRLCVETRLTCYEDNGVVCSRLRAAVC